MHRWHSCILPAPYDCHATHNGATTERCPPPHATQDPAALRFKGSLPRAGATAGGTTVRIFGRGFSAGDLAVQFGAEDAASVTILSDEEAEAVRTREHCQTIPNG